MQQKIKDMMIKQHRKEYTQEKPVKIYENISDSSTSSEDAGSDVEQNNPFFKTKKKNQSKKGTDADKEADEEDGSDESKD